MAESIAGYVCIVTGASRGIGKGIAVQLAVNGAKVYITGRTLHAVTDAKVKGSLRDTAEEIKARGGMCIPIQCDHSKDEDIERLFEQVKGENDGQLDILVNNAYSAVNAIFSHVGVKFWDQPLTMWDEVNNVGLRNHYMCSGYAARLMVPRKRGFIVNISSSGGIHYWFHPTYGIGKEACDRMAADCAFELRKENVAFVSLWPGPTNTEILSVILRDSDHRKMPEGAITPIDDDDKVQAGKLTAEFIEQVETPEFVGKCVVAMAKDPEIMNKSGKILMTYDLAREYGLKDKAGHYPVDTRQLNVWLKLNGFVRIAWFIPNWVKLPTTVLALAGNKFY